MSSHHFVKEGQEPALLILDALSFELAGPILEWAPLVIVSDQALDETLSWNIKLDVVLSEEDRVEELRKDLFIQSPITILSRISGESPLVNAVYYLLSKKQFDVIIMTADAENTMREVEQFTDRMQVTVMDGMLKWSAITTGRYEKWITAESPVFLRKTIEQTVHSLGLREVDNRFETIATGVVSLQAPGLFWVGEPYQ